MRLGTCIALEIVAALTGLGGLSLGTAYAVGELRGRAVDAGPAAVAQAVPPDVAAGGVVSARGVSAAGVSAAGVSAAGVSAAGVSAGASATVAGPVAAPSAPQVPAPVAVSADGPVWAFVGVSDETLLAPLHDGTLKRVKFNRGGSTLSLRIELDNGARAAFKPDQVIKQLPRREIAAYRLDRLLGIGRVPPAIAMSFKLVDLEAAVDHSQRGMVGRIRDQAVARKGVVRGAASWWIPVISDIYIGKARLDETDAILTWRKWLKVGATIPADRVALAQQLSTMALFDFLTDNIDRWSGNNAKVSADGKVLYFMDNTMSFGRSPKGNYRTRIYLERCQVFSRRLITRLRAIDKAAVRAVMVGESGPYEELLTETELEAVAGRREAALAYIDGLIEMYGEEKVLGFP